MRIFCILWLCLASAQAQFTFDNPGFLGGLSDTVTEEEGGGGGGIYSDAVFYLTLDETSGTRADSTSNGYDFSPTNSPAYESGALNNAVYFQRANDNCLGLQDNADVSLGGDVDVTVHLWFYLTNSATGYQGLIAKRESSSGSTAEWGLYYGNTIGDFSFYCYDGSSFDTVVTNIGGTPADTWYFIAAGRTAADDKVWISINAGDRITADSNTTVDGDAAVNLGRLWSDDTNNDVDGRIDEVSFWKSAKSEADIDTAYGSGTPPGYSP